MQIICTSLRINKWFIWIKICMCSSSLMKIKQIKLSNFHISNFFWLSVIFWHLVPRLVYVSSVPEEHEHVYKLTSCWRFCHYVLCISLVVHSFALKSFFRRSCFILKWMCFVFVLASFSPSFAHLFLVRTFFFAGIIFSCISFVVLVTNVLATLYGIFFILSCFHSEKCSFFLNECLSQLHTTVFTRN